MKIAFDQQVFLLQQYGGISRYICSLAQTLSALAVADVRVVAPLHFNFSLKELTGVPGGRHWLPRLHPKLFRLVEAASKFAARGEINSFRPDILHETYFTTDDYCSKGARRVVTVYDMIPERFSEDFDRAGRTSAAKRAAVERADHVICISESTRRDLIDLWNVPHTRVSVTYLAADAIFSSRPVEEVPPLHRPFLLFVGSRGGYKNFLKFLRAAARVEGIEDLDIVCFGGGTFTPAENAAIRDAGLAPEQLIQRSGDDFVLLALYRRALALVYPSLYEGFGIPPLEAMAADCPVITGNSSSLPEVVGRAGEYFDPLSEDDMSAAIQRVVSSPERRAELVALGRVQHSGFTWKKCALETLDAYRGLT